jgi:PAS domain S-box-containing protein
MMELDCAEASKRISAELDILAIALTEYVDDKNVRYKEDAEDRWLPVSEVKYRSLFQHAVDAIYLFNPKTKRVLDSNQAFLALIGYTAAEVHNLRIYDFITQDRDKIAAHVLHIVTSGAATIGEQVWRRKDGTLINVHTAVSIIKQGGRAIGFVIARNVTERKRAEDERERLQKESEAKKAELERLIYTISHDLRAPLVTLQGFVNMLREDLEQNEREKAENNLKYIEKAATKMEKLLNDTLQLSRIGLITSPPKDLPFGDIVEDALEQIAEQIKSSGVEVSVAENFPEVHVDQMQIAEVLVNLIVNSINYRSEHSRQKIEIGSRVDGGEPVFFVRDNGIGIDMSQHEKVFELFFRVDSRGEGTGAGLAIVKRIIEVHGGRVWIESEKGKGCTVCFTLPIA